MHPYWNWSHHGLWSMGWWGFGLEFLAWVLLGILMICLYRRYLKNQANLVPPTALDILNTRYARGEVTQEEYNLMKEKLK